MTNVKEEPVVVKSETKISKVKKEESQENSDNDLNDENEENVRRSTRSLRKRKSAPVYTHTDESDDELDNKYKSRKVFRFFHTGASAKIYFVKI